MSYIIIIITIIIIILFLFLLLRTSNISSYNDLFINSLDLYQWKINSNGS